MTLADLDAVYYRISKSWLSLSRRDRMLAIAELSQLEDQAAELGASGRKLIAEIRSLKGQVTQSLAE
jgi:hypothetical protein